MGEALDARVSNGAEIDQPHRRWGEVSGADNLGRTHLEKENRSGVGQRLELRKDGDLRKECQEVKREEGDTG